MIDILVSTVTRKFLQWKNADLGVCPQLPSEWNESLQHVPNFLVEASLTAEVPSGDHSEDLINGVLRRDGGVEDAKVALQARRYVVATAT